jgi:hypothetical protein
MIPTVSRSLNGNSLRSAYGTCPLTDLVRDMANLRPSAIAMTVK